MFSQDPPRLELIGVPELDDAQRGVHEAIANGPRRGQHQQGTAAIMDDAGRLLGPFAVMLLAPSVGGPLQQVGAALRMLRQGTSGRGHLRTGQAARDHSRQPLAGPGRASQLSAGRCRVDQVGEARQH